MPEIDGYELMRAVRCLEGPAGGVPAIAVTAFARDRDRERALSAGFQAHLKKPIDANELASLLITLVGRSGSATSP